MIEDFAMIIALLTMGATFGSLITAAWLSDRNTSTEPTEHGELPL